MSQLQFSWRNQKGYGLITLFFGWSLILQIPEFYHAYLLIDVPASGKDWLIFLGSIILVTAIIGSIMPTIFENLFDPFKETLVGAHTTILFTFIVYYFFYVLSVPTLKAIEPFLGLPTKIVFFGWGQYLTSMICGLLGLAIFWYISEMWAQARRT